MKRNSQHYVEQAAGRAAGVRLTAMHAASSAAATPHAPSACPASAYAPYAPSAYPASAYAPYAVAGKENTYGAAPSSKVAPPLLSPRYGSSLGSQLAATSSSQPQPHPQPPPPPPPSGSHLNPSLAARRAAPPHAGLSAREPGAPQLRPTGKWSINDEQMHQPWGKVLRNLGQPR